jgi:hypothetical protein
MSVLDFIKRFQIWRSGFFDDFGRLKPLLKEIVSLTLFAQCKRSLIIAIIHVTQPGRTRPDS